MSDRSWRAALTDEQRGALLWECIFYGVGAYPVPGRQCTAPDGDGHMFEPIKPTEGSA